MHDRRALQGHQEARHTDANHDGPVTPLAGRGGPALARNIPGAPALEAGERGHGADTLPVPVSIVKDLVAGKTPSPRRRMVLFVFQRDGVRTMPLEPGAAVILGRDPAAEIFIDDQSVSRRHARFVLMNGSITVEDLGSTNGTRVDGRPVKRSALAPGQEVTAGSVVAFVQEMSGAATSGGVSAMGPGIDAYDAFRDALSAELERARFFRRPFAVLTVRALQKDAGGSLRQVCARLRQRLRPVDHVALYGPASIEILLAEASEEEAIQAARNIVAERSDEPRLACGIALYPGSADSVDKLIEASRRAAREAGPAETVKLWSEGGAAWISSSREAAAEERLPVPAWMIAKSPAMRAVVETAARLGRSAIPVLLLGETGTGKEVIARFIHESGSRSDKPMVCINCAAIPGQLVESMLFGHERGAFTGAVQQQKGVFEAAEGGTVLLDEIGELPAAAQAALLRVLETRRLCRVGSTKEIEINVRVIAATHRDLEAMSEAQTFRADLLYRLNTMTVNLPPLRARRQDIALLADRFLHQANAANGAQIKGFAPDALALLEAYGWPGNVRELRNAVERAVVVAEGERIRDVDLPERVRTALGASARGDALAATEQPASGQRKRKGNGPPSTPTLPSIDAPPWSSASNDPGSDGLRSRMERYEADILLEALRAANWNQKEAAQLLNLPLRTLQHKVKMHGLRRLAPSGADTGSED
jgi:DNA-binding NtrC family response regulator